MTDEVADALTRLLPQLSRSAHPPTPEELRRFVGHEATTLLVARVDGVLVGTLTLVMFPLITGVRARVEDVVVDDSARNRGVGRALTEEALRLATAANARTVDLTSRPDREAANRLYRGLGFQPRESFVYRYSTE